MRERELSIRQAIGATRRQLIQYLLSEAVIMAGLGAILASLVLFILTAMFIRLNGEEKMGIPLSNVEYLSYVVGAAVAVLITVIASLAPARRAASVQPMVAMRAE